MKRSSTADFVIFGASMIGFIAIGYLINQPLIGAAAPIGACAILLGVRFYRLVKK